MVENFLLSIFWCLDDRFPARPFRCSFSAPPEKSLVNRIASNLKPILKVKSSRPLTAIRTVFGLTIRIVRFEVDRCEPVAVRIAAIFEPRFKTSMIYRRNPHAHKNKIGTSTPPSPPKTRNFVGKGVFRQKEPKNPGAHTIGAQPFPAPELQAEKLRTCFFFFFFPNPR